MQLFYKYIKKIQLSAPKHKFKPKTISHSNKNII